MKVDLWFTEPQNEDVRFGVRVRSLLFSKESKYQKIDVYDTEFFGRTLALDGCFMITEKDEFMYQEMLAHPALMSHRDPKKVLIIGGGDGGIAREVLKHPVDGIDLVEIDEEVISTSKVYLPSLASSFDDRRVRIYNQDAFEFADRHQKYDVILVDSTDPIGFAASLFSEVFYSKAKRMLGEAGILVTQSGSPFMNPNYLKKAVKGMREHFRHVKPYLSFVPSYPSGMWSYVMASGQEIRKNRSFEGKYINDGTYESCFSLPQFVEELISG